MLPTALFMNAYKQRLIFPSPACDAPSLIICSMLITASKMGGRGRREGLVWERGREKKGGHQWLHKHRLMAVACHTTGMAGPCHLAYSLSRPDNGSKLTICKVCLLGVPPAI